MAARSMRSWSGSGGISHLNMPELPEQASFVHKFDVADRQSFSISMFRELQPEYYEKPRGTRNRETWSQWQISASP
ncbi:hypothetical protein PHISCL_02836 [Aspergillus sclerotialis]|uniref:Uncharacterized protein n=1 Tax=Aspergillus sclerotialis TaxID=2070753 RepID=A0A3A2ZPE5_9EURO|nr:hypothetical protein PHISCL_02836 [Aspergillus sclerotialis]